MSNEIKFAVHTLGCKVNQYESEKIIKQLSAIGWKLVDFPSTDADAHIINTCTVTAVANHKSRQLIRRAINSNPNGIVAVTGCYADSDKADIEAIEGVDLVVGNGEKTDLPTLVARQLASRPGLNGKSFVSPERGAVNEELCSGENSKKGLQHSSTNNHAKTKDSNSENKLRTRSLVKVQDGCDNFCTYCIVAHVRGELWSKTVGEVVDEVADLVSSGTREIVLTGIHLGLYGVDARRVANSRSTGLIIEKDVVSATADLGDLLERLIEIPDLGRIRLSSIELNEITPKIVELMAASNKVCCHLHIPLQSGSDTILKRMNRHYTAQEFIERTQTLYQAIEDLAITTDIIVGFPGETDNDFDQTLKTVEAVGFSKLHVFKYSPRKGTPAALFKDQIPNNKKDHRSAVLIERGKQLSFAFCSQYVGRRLSVLIEHEQGEYYSGLSDNYIRVICKGSTECIGTLATVAIERQEEDKLAGTLLSSESGCNDCDSHIKTTLNFKQEANMDNLNQEKETEKDLFCKIAAKEIPAEIVYEDGDILAFRDIDPKAPVHILVIPKKHISKLSDVTDADAELLGKIIVAANRIARQEGIDESGYRLIANNGFDGGQEVFHVHFHILGGRALGRLVE